MNEKELKTSTKQRVFIALIAVIMVGSIIASYAAIVINGSARSNNNNEPKVDEAKVAEYTEAYKKKAEEFANATRSDFDRFIPYKSEVKAYNETSANEGGLQTKDLVEGTGRTLTAGDNDYMAYYVGWCADETVFDTSLNNDKEPTAFVNVLTASDGLIEGWKQGVNGMKIGGVRRITIPGELAYGETREICGGTNKPLRFLVMTREVDEKLQKLGAEVSEAFMRLQYTYYGIDYDSVSQNEG